MKALYAKGHTDPLSYLEQLGTDAIITILSSADEYVSRIRRGVNLKDEFLPQVDNEYSPTLKAFIANIQQKESNTSRLVDVSIKKDLLDSFRDCSTKEIADVPVRLDGDLFDLNTLVKLPVNSKGYRTNPLTEEPFLLSQLQPAKDVQRKIEEVIKSIPISNPESTASFSCK